jgi:two-component system sensor histidine kinase HydH
VRIGVDEHHPKRPAIMTSSSPALLVAANRAAALETVLRWMIHDFRNPMQTLTFLPVLTAVEAESGRPEEDTPGWREAFAIACERLTTNLALVDRLVGTPPQSAAPAPVALSEVLRYLADLFRARRGRFRIDFEGACGMSLPAIAAVRPDLESALLNLVLNAAEAAGAAEGTLIASASARSGGVELVLEDGGPGIPEFLRPRLFEPFATTRTDRPSRGLGLYAARHLLASFGGDLRYEPGNPGSRFIVSLAEWGSLPGR